MELDNLAHENNPTKYNLQSDLVDIKRLLSFAKEIAPTERIRNIEAIKDLLFEIIEFDNSKHKEEEEEPEYIPFYPDYSRAERIVYLKFLIGKMCPTTCIQYPNNYYKSINNNDLHRINDDFQSFLRWYIEVDEQHAKDILNTMSQMLRESKIPLVGENVDWDTKELDMYSTVVYDLKYAIYKLNPPDDIFDKIDALCDSVRYFWADF